MNTNERSEMSGTTFTRGAYEVMFTDGVDTWSTTESNGFLMIYDSFEEAKTKADEINGVVFTNDNHDIVYDASGTVDPEFIVAHVPQSSQGIEIVPVLVGSAGHLLRYKVVENGKYVVGGLFKTQVEAQQFIATLGKEIN